jgi:uncharacterized membrane-anchored protein
MTKFAIPASAMAFALLVAPVATLADAPPVKISPEMEKFEAGLHKQSGDIAIPGANATLHLGDRYYFIPADEAATVLTKVWGNPPSATEGVLGVVIEKGKSIYDNVWSAVVTYEDTGYVSDKNAKTEDYDKVEQQIRDGEADDNAQRQKEGYPAIHLVGWAQPPSYDPTLHSLIWARDLKFSDAPVDSLNYDVRLLGRKGVLSLNMLSTMNDLPDVRAAAADFGKAATFNPGSTYADYDASVDKTATYGLAGLVAAGAGIVIAKKLGFLAIALGLGKWILGGLAVAGAAMRRWIGKLFGRRQADG